MHSDESLYLENQLCFPLYAASRMTIKLYGPLLKKLNITYPQYLVLLVLWKNGEQNVQQIGSQLFLESNTLTPLLKRMEEKRLIKRKRSDVDERNVVISLSDKGVKLKEEALCIPAQLIENFTGTDSLSSREVMAFKETLNKILSVLHMKTVP